MPRSRNIKPGFFKNEELAQCEPLARILFAALWCEADREGRLLDRPLRLKAEYLPYDNCDCNALLVSLTTLGLIVRYEVNGVKYIAIPKFMSHQNPHQDEKSKNFPPPPQSDTPGQPNASTVSAPGQHENGTEARRLIPDSLNLIPESSNKPAAGNSLVGKKPVQTAAAGLVKNFSPEVQIRAERLAKSLGVSATDDFEFGYQVCSLVVDGKLSERIVSECASDARGSANGNPIGLFRIKLRGACKRKKIRLDELIRRVRLPPDFDRGPPAPPNEVLQLAQALSRKDS